VKPVELDPAARAELDAAATFYEADYEGRGFRFYAAIERVLLSIERLPGAGHAFPGISPALDVHRRRVPGFPFAIAYRIRADSIRVVAVIHARRRPGYWLARVR
jgi:plasmid stabilization system protein ParE